MLRPKNKLFMTFFLWWACMSVGLQAVSHFNLQYDAGGTEGSIWWIVFLLAIPYNVAREYIAEIIPNSSHSIVGLLSYVAASLVIILFYLMLNYLKRIARDA